MGWSRAGNVHRALLSFSEILSETELVWKEAVGLVPFPSTQPPALTLLWHLSHFSYHQAAWEVGPSHLGQPVAGRG